MKPRRDLWKRCWRGRLPKRRKILIYDSNERLSVVDSTKDRFFEYWEQATGGKIRFFIDVSPLPFETYLLFDPAEFQSAA